MGGGGRGVAGGGMEGVGSCAASTRRRSARSALSYCEYDVHGSHFSQGSVGRMLGVSIQGEELASICGDEGSTGGEAARVGGGSTSSPSSSSSSTSSSPAGNIWASVWSGSKRAAQEPSASGGHIVAGRWTSGGRRCSAAGSGAGCSAAGSGGRRCSAAGSSSAGVIVAGEFNCCSSSRSSSACTRSSSSRRSNSEEMEGLWRPARRRRSRFSSVKVGLWRPALWASRAIKCARSWSVLRPSVEEAEGCEGGPVAAWALTLMPVAALASSIIISSVTPSGRFPTTMGVVKAEGVSVAAVTVVSSVLLAFTIRWKS